VKLPCAPAFHVTRGLVRDLALRTVCQSAKCPNQFECFSRGTATFLIMGDTCTRNCAFCNIRPGAPAPPEPDEPARVASAAARLKLRHAVVTSVTRDDLADGGAAHFAATVLALRRKLPRAGVEVLIPDFQGDADALAKVAASGPRVINHNVETPPAHYGRIRPQAVYERSLELLRRVAGAGIVAKSGLMVGLGETDEEVEAVLADLAGAGCGIVTVGQYLRPSRQHPPVARYVRPEIFDAYAAKARKLGIRHVFSAPLVRSSYQAGLFA
jgi:lipoic acid synthetase